MTAEIGVETKANLPSPAASMRPRPNDRGNAGRHVRADVAAVASMRPRPNDRGNPKITLDHPRSRRASMRPRPNDRGNSDGGLAWFSSLSLQ